MSDKGFVWLLVLAALAIALIVYFLATGSNPLAP